MPSGQRLAGGALVVGGILAIPMVTLLLAMYAAFGVGASSTALTLGWLNDVLAIPVYGLVLAAVPVLHRRVGPAAPTGSLILAAIGAAGIVATIVLQWLLVTEQLTFEEQIGPVSIALLAVGVWTVGTGYLGRSVGFLPRGVRNGALAAVYLGFPVWAIDLGRRLRRSP